MMQWLAWYWYGLLEWPAALLRPYLGDLTRGWPLFAYKVVVSFLLFTVFLEAIGRVRRFVRRLRGKDGWLEAEELVPLPREGTAFAESLDAARHLDKTVAPLKKARQYGRVAEIYASLNRHKDAAKWFGKARDRRRAATEWALAGHTVKAADLLMKEGDYATAGRFYEEKGKYLKAAKAYTNMPDLPGAARAYAMAKKFSRAAATYTDYFANNTDDAQAQLAAADACLAMLESEAGRAAIPPETRHALLPAVASRFEQAGRHDPAARLFREAGQLGRAGEIYVRAGNLEEAARCMRDAGRIKEAHQIGARYYELHGRWAEAGMAYAGAGDFRRAGDCFAKVNDAQRSAECYEKAGEFYGAALAYSHLGRFDEAIRLLQQIREADRAFDPSRALLGRCFYELHDYAHCAAALDNHLTGKRVESTNIDYFYMLALACEQLGKLDRSQEILYKIRAVNVGYKDVTQRLSNISSRISMGADGAQVQPPRPASLPEETQIMEMVENLLGGRYRLEQELGRGGMGVVYLARDTQLDRPVALKFLGSIMDDSEDFRQRFIREAKAAARVNHPNIISIYDISANTGRAYIAMEYVQGVNLHQYTQEKGRLSPREAASIAAQACSALEAIHGVGVVHRDIKPDNILLAKGGLVKLTDFGLAKAADTRITGTGVIMGTPSYMSPEQTRHSDVDARSDIYSLGLVLHEMLTGNTVFGGPDVIERQQREMPEPPSTVVPGIPQMLDDIVMKCIAKEPERRFQTAAALLAALRETPRES